MREIEREMPVEIFLQHAQIPKLMQIIVVTRIIHICNCSFDGLLFFQISGMDINLVCEYNKGTVESTIGLNRGENGTGKSRPDRLRIPFYPTIYRFHRENMKPVRKREESLGCRNGNDFAFFLTVSSDPVFHPGITVLFPF